MGVVYEGFDPRIGRRVAIKTILKSQIDEQTTKDRSQRFEREAQALGRLTHQHIVQVYDFGEEGDIAYLVMEFVKGRDLKSFFDANERFDLREGVRIMGELCAALDFAHRAGVVHRDVKPGNVMLDSEMRAKLTDFGVARVKLGTLHMTQTGALVGTPAYMSPEQITGRPVDARSDVFAAGIILYQFLTGELPFTGAGAWTIAKKIMQDEPTLPSTIDTAVSPLFDAVVAKALAKQPEQRFQTAGALSAALKRALEGKPDDADATVVAMPVKSSPSPVSRLDDADVEFWRSIKDGNDPRGFDLYLEQFPSGIYAKLAQHKVSSLRSSSQAPTSSPATATSPVGTEGRSLVVPALCAAVVAIGAVVWFIWTRAPTELPAAKTSGVPMTADSPEPGQQNASAAKIAQEKAAQANAEREKAAVRAAEEKAATDKLVAEKLAQQKADEERTAAEKSTKEKQQREKLAAEKLEREKAERDKTEKVRALAALAAAEKAFAERQAAEKKAAAEKQKPAATPGPATAPLANAQEEMRREYQAALNSFKNGDYRTTISQMDAFLRNYPDSTLAPNALYWIGMSYCGLRNYTTCIETQERMLGKWPNSDRAPDAMLSVASANTALGNRDAEMAALNSLIAKYPASQPAVVANERLARLLSTVTCQSLGGSNNRPAKVGERIRTYDGGQFECKNSGRWERIE